MALRPYLYFAQDGDVPERHNARRLTYPGCQPGRALLAHDQSSRGGFVKVARAYDGVELVGISRRWPKTGTASGGSEATDLSAR